MQCVASVLLQITAVHECAEEGLLVRLHEGLGSVVAFDVHIYREHVEQQVIVVVGHIRTHSVISSFGQDIAAGFLEGAVALIEVGVIVHDVVVTYEYVHPAIIIDVAGGN